MPRQNIIKDKVIVRSRLSKEARELLFKYCESADIHVELNVSYKQVAECIFGWLNRQNMETWNEVIKILETELLTSKDKCFSGRLSRLISTLDGFHPGVRIMIATADQISNRVLSVLSKGRENNLDADEILGNALRELRSLELTEVQVNEWLEVVRENLEDYE
jgi:hypothetical protein